MVQTRLILWVGKKHSGKTTSAFQLANTVRKEGFNVAGLLALSLYRNRRLVGFDAFDLQSENRAPLARRKIKENEAEPFTFIHDGLKLGSISLSSAATKSADLIIIDEFGPLELNQLGWRKNADSLLSSSDAIILLVVRQELVNVVVQLYKNVPSIELLAGEQDSVDHVVTLLRNCRQKD